MLKADKIKHISYKKIITSIIFGLLGFWLNFHAVSFLQFPDLQVSILFGLLFPLMITLFWGWKYGLISALFGGCQTMWWLWFTDGYGFLYAVPVFTLWIVWHGFWSDYRKTHQQKWYHNIYIVEIVFRIFSELGFYTIFRWLVSLNPPPWAPEIINNFVPYSWVHFVAVKHTITAYVLLLVCDVIMHTSFIRKYFLPKEKIDYTKTTYIVSASLLIGFFLWTMHSVMDYYVFFKGKDSFLNIMFTNIPLTSLFSRNLLLFFSLIVGLVLSRVQLNLNIKTIELTENEKLLNKTQQIAKIGGWEYNVSEKALKFTDEVFRIYGLPKNESLSLEKLRKNYHPDDRIKIIDVFNKAINEGKRYSLEVRLINAQKKLLWIKITGEPLIENNKTVKLIGNVLDIAERKQAEEKLAKYRKHLELLVEERTIELQNTNKELEAFAYSVSHDLRGPLRAISGFTRILMEDYVEKLDDEGKRLGGIIQKNTRKMAQLIDDLLTFSRMGRVAMKFSKINMKEMVTAIYHEATDEEARKRITFTVADLPKAGGDTTMMRQVWMNLISNAVKFSSNREQAVISVSCQEKENQLIYCIKDNGSGFNMKYKDKLFGVFQRLHSEKEFEGTGVGLALIQRIIYRHGGKVWAESEVDHGAAFYFSLLKNRRI